MKTHVKALLHKIGVRNRTQAAVWAINRLGPSRLAEAKSLKQATGLPMLLARLHGAGGIGPDVADEPAVPRPAEQILHAVAPGPGAPRAIAR